MTTTRRYPSRPLHPSDTAATVLWRSGLRQVPAHHQDQAVEVARRKAFVILDGTLLRIDRVAMASAIRVPQRRRRLDPDSGRYRRLSRNQKEVNAAHAQQRGPGERVNAELKDWRILRKIRSCPSRASELVAAVQTLLIANA